MLTWAFLVGLVAIVSGSAAGLWVRRRRSRLGEGARTKRLGTPTGRDPSADASGAPSPRVQAWLTTVGRAFSLASREGGLRGTAEGWPVTLTPRPGPGYHGLALRIDGQGRMPESVSLKTRAEPPADLFAASRYGVDDARFDRVFEIAGDSATMLALLSKATRVELLGLAEASDVRLRRGTLEVLSDERLERPPAIQRWVQRSLHVAGLLSIRPEEVERRLEGHVASHDLASVRLANLEALQDHRSEAQILALLREGTRDHDPAFRLQAAALLNDVRTVEAVAHDRHAPPVVRARALLQGLDGRRERDDGMIRRALESARGHEVQVAFAEGLEAWGHPAAQGPLLDALLRSSLDPTAAAAYGRTIAAVGGGAEAERALLEALGRDHAHTRALIAALGEVGGEDSAGALARAREGHGKGLQRQIAQALARIEARAAEAAARDDVRGGRTTGRLSLLDENAGGLSLSHRDDAGALAFPRLGEGGLALRDEAE